ncbi:MAG: hypothetical protein LJE69_20655 [Thiohalocapsa sp.]|uniref:hypothetical protein n=1 Tax=Thiohalocapsa sp. TaxID=2497641 RepID=UPI0025F4B70F|nr:hypothetical protein [Thiohalocapsa sp.]MCG6943648.1 hypothetical protein [Thiohalocapsa sp.]
MLPCLLFCWLLLAGALLREQPCFWVDACGVPRLLRAILQQGFWPGLGAFAFLLAGLSLPRVRRLAGPGIDIGNLLRAPIVWLWVAFAALVLAASADNLFNLAVGLPLHSDTPVQCCCSG